MLSYTMEGVTFSVEIDRYDGERWVYKWTISEEATTGVGRTVIATASDLRSGMRSADRPESLAKMLETLMGFLGAYCEARDYEGSENRDLFPDACLTLTERFDSDMFAMAEGEIL